MRDISIMNVPNGGFLIADFREGKSIAAFTNSGDLIRWITQQFERRRNETAGGQVLGEIDPCPEPEQDGFITSEPEWISYSGVGIPYPMHERVDVKLRDGRILESYQSSGLIWAWTDDVTAGNNIVSYRWKTK